jgi:hypothetical protein
MTDNVIKFPSVSELPVNQEELIERLVETREKYASEVADECFEAVATIANSFGIFSNLNKVHPKDMVAIYELLYATFLRYSGIEHPLQEIIDHVIVLDSEKEVVEIANDSEDFDKPVEL